MAVFLRKNDERWSNIYPDIASFGFAGRKVKPCGLPTRDNTGANITDLKSNDVYFRLPIHAEIENENYK